jgi:3-deoxy-D-manno-octulosonic acid kinase
VRGDGSLIVGHPASDDVVKPRRSRFTHPCTGTMVVDATRIAQDENELFDPAHYAQATPVSVGGRQSAWYVSAGFGEGVLRYYRRGGMAARVSRETYFWLGESRTRSFAEFELLMEMHGAGLPVPRPIAAAYWRSGMGYRAAILVERKIPVRALAECLNEPVWEAVAGAIAAMHHFGVWHADLNAFNILIDAMGHAWLIDFDRGRRRRMSRRLRQANLLRLRRSLEKIGGEAGVALWSRIEARYHLAWSALRA